MLCLRPLEGLKNRVALVWLFFVKRVAKDKDGGPGLSQGCLLQRMASAKDKLKQRLFREW